MDGATRVCTKQGTEAMKKTTLIAGLLALVGAGSTGCKTTPKMAFWKSEKTAESTAVAHTAPTLPSDLAKQGGTAQSTVAQAGGEAGPFVAGQVARTSATAAPTSGYPSTDAPPFTPDVASRITSATPSTSSGALTSSAPSLGSIAASPYNPAATPNPTIPTTPALPSRFPDSRYASSSTSPLYGQTSTGAVGSVGSAISGAGAAGATAGVAAPGGAIPGVPNIDASLAAPRFTSSQTASVGGAAAYDAASSYTNRYNAAIAGTTNAAATGIGQVTGAAANTAGAANGAVQSATTAVVTTGQPYRPGGTSTYPTTGGTITTQAEVQVASRPQGTAGASTATGSTTTNEGVSGSPAAPTIGEAPRYR
jgi:hypothetical protein